MSRAKRRIRDPTSPQEELRT